MTLWCVRLCYRLKDNLRVRLEAEVGVEASSGVDAKYVFVEFTTEISAQSLF